MVPSQKSEWKVITGGWAVLFHLLSYGLALWAGHVCWLPRPEKPWCQDSQGRGDGVL